MKKFILFFAMIFAFALVNSQEFWEEVPIPDPGASIASINVDDNGHLVLATIDNIYHSDNEGDTWTQCQNWPGYWANSIQFNSNNDVFIGTSSNGMMRSVDGAATFTQINNGLGFLNVWTVIVLENDDILAGTPGGIYRSQNNGDSWSLLGTGLPDDEIQRIAVADNGYLFAGTMQSGIYRSTNNGANWEESNGGLPDSAMVTAMIGTPDGNVYAGIYPEGMYRTTDYGNLWEPYNNGLPFNTAQLPSERFTSVDQMLHLIAYLICIVYFFGMYYLDANWDMDYSWYPLNEGLPDEPTTSCMASGPDERLFLGTWDQGLFRNAIPVNVRQNRISSEKLTVSNYPNPFINQTQFNIHLPETSLVSVSVFNQNGDLVEILENNILQSGNHHINWEPENLSKGIYYLKIETSSDSKTHKIVKF